MANALATRNEDNAALMESVVVDSDLSKLSPTQRLDYYQRVCESVGLNPFTRPFDYMRLNGKLVLYAKKDASEQLRKIHGISLSKPDVQYVDDLIVVTIEAVDATGRSDSDIGAVTIGNLKGEAKANAIMKAITKAKRRVTLSIAGLGWLDETELETIPAQAVQRVNVDMATGEIVDVTPVTPATNGHTNGNGHKPTEAPAVDMVSNVQLRKLNALGTELYGADWTDDKRHALVAWKTKNRTESSRQLTADEADSLIAGLQKRINEAAAEIQTAPEPEPADNPFEDEAVTA